MDLRGEEREGWERDGLGWRGGHSERRMEG